MDSKKIVFHETAVVLIGQVLCIGAMFGVYGLLGKFGLPVVLGGLVGGLVAVLNFFFMAIAASLAADKAAADDVKGGKALISASYMGRLAVMAVVLIACGVSGYFDLIALVLPLAFTRPILTVGEFFRKSGDKTT